MPWPNEQAGYIDDFDPVTFNSAQAPTINTGGTITSAAGTYNAANGIVLNGSNGIPLKMKELAGGWQYSDMTTLQSGGSGTMGMSGTGLAGSSLGLATRPDQVAPVTYPKQWRKAGAPWFSTSSFAKPPSGYFGNVGNGAIREPGIEDFNMVLYITFPFTERLHLQFRAEFFNASNHTNPNGPTTTVGSASDGKISSEKEAREGEGALKLIF